MISAYEGVQVCIRANRLDLALQILQTALKDSDLALLDTVTLLENTYSNISRSHTLNQISYEDYLRQTARLSNSIQSITNEAKQANRLNGLIEKPVVPFVELPKPSNTFKMLGLLIGLLSCLGGGYWVYQSSISDKTRTESIPNVTKPDKPDTVVQIKQPDKSENNTAVPSKGGQKINPPNTPPTKGNGKKSPEPVRKPPSNTGSLIVDVPKEAPSVKVPEEPMVLVTIYVNSDLSHATITVDGKEALIESDNLSVKKIFVKANANHKIQIGDCVRSLYVKTDPKTISCSN